MFVLNHDVCLGVLVVSVHDCVFVPDTTVPDDVFVNYLLCIICGVLWWEVSQTARSVLDVPRLIHVRIKT